ncbi:hypothetical protein B2J93_9474 [Marssonina coronariae]|uniref:Uncharacterized protein n=1 Tax=Diplocarpon coronariae TaxID=2795749 RepID=A0A218YXP2_9HELO|nr:hypothetical protein B2J93_9474 [Marssonina coronariae]
MTPQELKINNRREQPYLHSPVYDPYLSSLLHVNHAVVRNEPAATGPSFGNSASRNNNHDLQALRPSYHQRRRLLPHLALVFPLQQEVLRGSDDPELLDENSTESSEEFQLVKQVSIIYGVKSAA